MGSKTFLPALFALNFSFFCTENVAHLGQIIYRSFSQFMI